MEILILIGLIVLNGLFAMSEIALVTARKARLTKQANDGDRAAVVALKLGEDPTQFLSTIQIGITSIGLLNGIVGEAILAAPFSLWLQSLGMALNLANIVATVLVVVVVTYVSIVVGELVPKRLGQIAPETIARLVARPIQILAMLTRPFVLLLSVSTHGLLRFIGIKQDELSRITEEEIHAILAEGSEAGIIEQHQHEMLRNVFRLDERQLGSLMNPRSNVVYIDIRHSPEENLRRIIDSEHSRFPVCDGGLDRILGVIHAKQVLACIAQGKQPNYEADLLPCIYMPERLTGLQLLEQFRDISLYMAFVIDEYGEVEGIVTLQDIIKAVTGELLPTDDKEAWAVLEQQGSWLFNGSIPILEVKDRLALKRMPDDKRPYHTLSGMMLLLLDKMPVLGDIAQWEEWQFEVVEMSETRIEKVRVSPNTK